MFYIHNMYVLWASLNAKVLQATFRGLTEARRTGHDEVPAPGVEDHLKVLRRAADAQDAIVLAGLGALTKTSSKGPRRARGSFQVAI